VVDEKLMELHQRHTQNDTRPNLDELIQLLGTCLSQYEKAFIAVDDLNEWLNEPT